MVAFALLLLLLRLLRTFSHQQIRAWRGSGSSQATSATDSKRTALAEYPSRFHPLPPAGARLLSRSAERTTGIAGKSKHKLQPDTPNANRNSTGPFGERVLLGNSGSKQSLGSVILWVSRHTAWVPVKHGSDHAPTGHSNAPPGQRS